MDDSDCYKCGSNRIITGVFGLYTFTPDGILKKIRFSFIPGIGPIHSKICLDCGAFFEFEIHVDAIKKFYLENKIGETISE